MSEIKMTADEAIEFLSTAALTGKKNSINSSEGRKFRIKVHTAQVVLYQASQDLEESKEMIKKQLEVVEKIIEKNSVVTPATIKGMMATMTAFLERK